MAITSISRLQQRRGVRADLPTSLAEGEFGWCLDTRELFIGNSDGYGDNSQVLTEHSANTDLITNKFRTFASEIQSAIVRPLGPKLDDWASVKDFGAKGDGVTDDAPAINAAISSLLSFTGLPTGAMLGKRVELRMPAGIYKISTPLLLYPYLTLVGDGYGKTVILAGTPMSCMVMTADSVGNTGSNIGTSGATLPTRIVVANLSFNTNGFNMDAAQMTRYSAVRFENVEIAGGWVPGTGVGSAYAGVRLQSIGNAVSTYDFQMVGGVIRNFSYAVYSDDPVIYTTLSRTRIHRCWRGLNMGEFANFGGPSWTSISQSRIYNMDDAGVFCVNNQPGVISQSNTYIACCLISGAAPIYWGVSSIYNASIGDVFNVSPGVINLGTENLIFNPQQNALLQFTVNVVTSGSSITINPIDKVTIINKSSPSVTNVTLPSSPSVGSNYIIKDGAGNSFTYPITVFPSTGNIDGGNAIVVNTSYEAITLIFNGTNWNVI